MTLLVIDFQVINFEWFARHELGKTLDRHLFVAVHLKGFVQLSHLHHTMYIFRRIQKLQLAALGLHGQVSAGKFPNPRAVHQIDLREIEEDLGAATFDQIVNSAAKRQSRCSETNIPAKVHDGDGTDLPLICGQRWHVCLSESREIARRFLTKAKNRPRSREAGSDPKSASHTLAYTPSDKPVQGNVRTKSRVLPVCRSLRIGADHQKPDVLAGFRPSPPVVALKASAVSISSANRDAL